MKGAGEGVAVNLKSNGVVVDGCEQPKLFKLSCELNCGITNQPEDVPTTLTGGRQQPATATCSANAMPAAPQPSTAPLPPPATDHPPLPPGP